MSEEFRPMTPLEALAYRLRRVGDIVSVWLSVKTIKNFTDGELVRFARHVVYGAALEEKVLLWHLRFHHAGLQMNEAQMKALALELADGDEPLAEILEWEMHFYGGRAPTAPSLHEGIHFWMVGQNASHQFFAGTKDGKRYRYSVGEGLEEGEIDISPVQEVADWSGYYGHF